MDNNCSEIKNDLQTLESKFCKLSELFYTSLYDLKNYAPFLVKEGEKNMENSEINQNRINFERIQNYEENKYNYAQIIEKHSNEMNMLFDNISVLISELKEKKEFYSTDEELNKNLKNLKKENQNKAESIEKKLVLINELIEKAKLESVLSKELSDKMVNERDLMADFDMDNN